MPPISERSETAFRCVVTIAVYGLKIIGLAPFSLDIKTAVKNSRDFYDFGYSKIGLAYSILILILFQLLTVLSVPDLVRLTDSIESRVWPFRAARDILYGLATNAIIISWAYRQKLAASVLNRIFEVERLLTDMENRPLISSRTFVSFAGNLIFSASLLATVCTTTSSPSVTAETPSWVFFVVSMLVTYWFVVQYAVVVGLVGKGLGRVNENLSRLNDFRIRSSRESHLDVKLILKIRTALYEASRDLAEFFSFPILLSIACNVWMFIYYAHLFVQFNTGTDVFNQINFINNLTRALVVVYPLVSLSLKVTRTSEEAKLTGWMVHRLMATATARDIKVELKRFSMQLLHEHISFTAYDFFSLDVTLLLSISAATTLYIVVLMQIQV